MHFKDLKSPRQQDAKPCDNANECYSISSSSQLLGSQFRLPPAVPLHCLTALPVPERQSSILSSGCIEYIYIYTYLFLNSIFPPFLPPPSFIPFLDLSNINSLIQKPISSTSQLSKKIFPSLFLISFFSP